MQSPLLEAWRFYCSGLKSPETFIDMSFFGIISAALQRRIWAGSTERPCFPNQYIVLVGGPTVGKGLVLRPAGEILKYHKKNPLTGNASTMSAQAIMELEEARQLMRDIQMRKGEEAEERLLIPIAANATTYEALLQENARTVSRINFAYDCPLAPNRIYSHNSLSFILEELASLFKEKAEEIKNYLIEAWDCGEYKYKTKHQGTDIIRRCCLNFIAGTTPVFMREAFRTRYTEDGFTSRVVFVYEEKSRFERFGIPDFSLEQIACKQRIIDRVKELSCIYGNVIFSTEAYEYLKDFFENIQPKTKPNNSIKLESYYGRKDMHVQKLAMAMHFADNNSMVIELETVKRALDMLERLEQKMHLALSIDDIENPLAKPSRRIKKYLGTGPKTKNEIIIELDGDPRWQDCLTWLVESEQIVRYHEQKTGKAVEMYKLNLV